MNMKTDPSDVTGPVDGRHPVTCGAFTLVELIVVLAVISMLLAFAAPSLARVIAANRLTAAGEGLLFKISLAQQVSVTESRPVELRLYSYTADGEAGFHAYQLFFLNESGGAATAMENPTYLGEGSVMIAKGGLSPLLDALNGGKESVVDVEPFKTLGAKYQSLVFYPNGSTNIHLPLRSAYITMAQPGSFPAAGSNSTPDNYYTLQIDPVTGRGRSYRP